MGRGGDLSCHCMSQPAVGAATEAQPGALRAPSVAGFHRTGLHYNSLWNAVAEVRASKRAGLASRHAGSSPKPGSDRHAWTARVHVRSKRLGAPASATARECELNAPFGVAGINTPANTSLQAVCPVLLSRPRTPGRRPQAARRYGVAKRGAPFWIGPREHTKVLEA